MEERYNPKETEKKWQKRWEEQNAFATIEDSTKPTFYVLEMFPYPSGKLHMGHVRVYVIGDCIARFMRMRGYNVLHPMGWDALGLPAENAAVREGIHPRVRTLQNIENVKRQMFDLGLSYDWSREIATCDENYYKWNQWFFVQMHRMGIVERKLSPVNWCPKCATVLANEQVVDEKCWRCESQVVEREVPEWTFRISEYAQQLLDDLEKLKEWPERIVTMQRNWLGRSEGTEIEFPVSGTDAKIRVFTTRPDTIFGATFMVLAPEHRLTLQLTTQERRKEVHAFVEKATRTSKIVRTAEGTEKEGVFLGSFAINPFTQEQIPIYTANFVVAQYGTGAIMCVPAHDQRDFEFAKRYGLTIRVVIQPPGVELSPETMEAAYEGEGKMVNSGIFHGTHSEEGKRRITAYAEEKGIGKETVNWHMKDWGFSRQRYWGTPIPVVYCESCGTVLVPEEQLPVVLPPDVEITGREGAPLSHHDDFINTRCPSCGRSARREPETMDTFVDSSWYFARYLSPQNDKFPFSPEAAARWLPVDIYVGGPEHAVMHLLYFRFFTKVMRDLGLLKIAEPVRKLVTQGMVLKASYWCEVHKEYMAEEEAEKREEAFFHKGCGGPVKVNLDKMSKSLGNVVPPDDLIEEYGADTARLFVLFAAPPEKDLVWSPEGVEGAWRFLQRMWKLVATYTSVYCSKQLRDGPLSEAAMSLRRKTHQTIKKVTEEISERLHLNTAVAAIMELVNETTGFLQSFEGSATAQDVGVLGEAIEAAILLLCPFAPHIAEEMWERLGRREGLAFAPWPLYDPEIIRAEMATVVIQVNGKVRSRIEVRSDATRDQIAAAALADERVRKFMAGKPPKKVVVVGQKLVSIVV